MRRGVGVKFILFVVVLPIIAAIIVVAFPVVKSIAAMTQPPVATPARCEFKSWFDPDYGCEYLAAPGCGVTRRLNYAGQPLACRGPRNG